MVIILKIISGKYKGRNLKGYNIEGTRPTQERVKESLFSMIQGYIPNSTCLDLFAGSGNLGIESLSNGSKFCYFVDNNKVAINTINCNLKMLDDNYLEFSKVLKSDYKDCLNYFKKNQITFDIIFLDPPYKTNYLTDILCFIDNNSLLNENGIIVVEYEFDTIFSNYKNMTEIKSKKYGYKKIKIYKKK